MNLRALRIEKPDSQTLTQGSWVKYRAMCNMGEKKIHCLPEIQINQPPCIFICWVLQPCVHLLFKCSPKSEESGGVGVVGRV